MVICVGPSTEEDHNQEPSTTPQEEHQRKLTVASEEQRSPRDTKPRPLQSCVCYSPKELLHLLCLPKRHSREFSQTIPVDVVRPNYGPEGPGGP
ncbi:hypothetical protein NDU88_002306 [Pleurodeles waltl]|uniref:Uncharacterized protein n=1 Tax=Pleurodeles waltl TaxID=8319 RepID=A0AAV7NG28_PLEWA|nr:hypothetical protein NDU88_002306 [Pleurodeles waltl]